jgi:nucleoside-diphosphate-sugar epimerase
MSKGKILVAGGAGFLGSWLCDYLIDENHEVVCIDNLSSGQKNNIEHLLSNPNFKFVKDDVRGIPQVGGQIDYVFHLASRASPADFETHSVDILTTNSVGTQNMLEFARKNDARFLLASSSEVYGDAKIHPQPEGYWGNVNPVGSRSCYDEGKRFSESLSMAYHRKYGLDVRIARIFNTYGPRMRPDDGRVISNFITQALEGRPLTVYGDGSQTRSFCYVSDMTEGLARLAFIDELSGTVLNLGSPEEIKILEVAKLVKELTGSISSIAFRPLPKDDPAKRRPDITNAKEKLNWEPKIGLKEGLEKTIEYFRTRRNR